ncbi:MAG: insulinase family protein, partial [Alphaproteobacteria bacterium]|nr:insulinase family protein [Alphaproteobacteria bacterium]
MRFYHFLAALTLSSSLTPLLAQPAPAPVSALVDKMHFAYEQFRLANGLRVIVHSDQKAPVVSVAIWYHIGSKDEPAGRSGFAHLFEHLMFAGSEHAKGSVIQQMESLGATDLNGSTWFDRTNYYETVPVGSLDRALFIESDRMGYLLGGVPQSTLDLQRSVVQNEKRGDDNEPYGMVQYAEEDGLFPTPGNPYGHTTIGSMADLDHASLEDVRAWFREHYGPNNAVLVLSGDIDLATARAKAERWFGSIKGAPAVIHPQAPIPTLPAPKLITLTDRVATTRVSRFWTVPGVTTADNVD